jgi:hypothetical protein
MSADLDALAAAVRLQTAKISDNNEVMAPAGVDDALPQIREALVAGGLGAPPPGAARRSVGSTTHATPWP